MLASVPEKPTDTPVEDTTVTTGGSIKVTYGSPVPNNGGTPIISYELQIDDGRSGLFKSVNGYSADSMLLEFTIKETDIMKGTQHRIRYRSKNVIGWGAFSDETTVLAASKPNAPPKPVFDRYETANSGTLYINLFKSPSNGGASISAYELERDDGDDFTSSFTKLTTYNGKDLQYGATNSVDGIVIGKVYRFRYRAINIVGLSDWSEEAYIAFGDVPPQPNAVTRIFSFRTEITVRWDEVIGGSLPVTGYILSMDNGQNSVLTPVYIGTNRPDIL
jgi:hypothetical protein